jgi:hypothetical protein
MNGGGVRIEFNVANQSFVASIKEPVLATPKIIS